MVEHHAEFEEKIGEIVNLILCDYEKGRDIDQMDVFAQPDKAQVTNLVQKLMIVVFPGYYREKVYRSFNDNNRLTMIMEDVLYNLRKQIFLALRYQEDFAQRKSVRSFFRKYRRSGSLSIRIFRRPLTETRHLSARRRLCSAIRVSLPRASTGWLMSCIY